MTSEARLRKTLGAPGLEWLVARVRDRMVRDVPLTGTVMRKSATIIEREALARFIGQTVSGSHSISVVLDDVDRLLRTNGIASGGLPEAIITLVGPITIRRIELLRLRDEWTAAYEPLRILGAKNPRWTAWVEHAEESGALRRRSTAPAEARILASHAALVLERLPAGGISLAVLANEVFGDSHALDSGRAAASLVHAAIRSLDPESGSAPPRQLWESVGVASDELSSTVLAHALPYSSRDASGTSSALPHYLTLQQLDRLDLFEDDLSGVEIFVCENPSVIAAAAGIRSRPLVCLRGQPSAATLRLLTQLTSAGATLRYHGDFDWGGIRIANGLFRRFGFTPWRFQAADYERLAENGTTPILGDPVDAVWDPALTGAMTHFGIKVEEEAVLNALTHDVSSE